MPELDTVEEARLKGVISDIDSAIHLMITENHKQFSIAGHTVIRNSLSELEVERSNYVRELQELYDYTNEIDPVFGRRVLHRYG